MALGRKKKFKYLEGNSHAFSIFDFIILVFVLTVPHSNSVIYTYRLLLTGEHNGMFCS